MENICCKRLIPAEWDKKEIVWRDKPFYKSRYRSFLHVPINIGKKITEGMKAIGEAGLVSEQMVLSKNDTMWGAEILIPISQRTGRFKTELVTGRFFTRLFEGNYADMKKWIKETKRYCESRGLAAKEFIFWYATCPKCAKKYEDKVQIVVFARVG
ncbi:MAG: hypothetical protein PHP25_05280 [Candidatus Moranbacteria bacterium]|nr:hypothetical protein [Candidatus Moranbacteria bacterium]